MKYLLLLAVVVGVLWFLRSRAAASTPAGGAARRADTALPMVSCAHCGLHLPRAEAVVVADGSYCSEAHRLAHHEPSRGL